ncbi:Mesoderm induction early response protein 3 [Nymphon striatum]|nr:Mesoderm induction early response protein 3 [Nymphon striatum]
MAQIQPFQFEPEYATEEEGEQSLSSSQPSSKDDRVFDERASRMGEQSWCESQWRNVAVQVGLQNPGELQVFNCPKMIILLSFILIDTDKEFDPSADMLVHDYDDEHTLDEEEETEMDSGGDSTVNELDNLQKEGEMPLEDLLTMYGYGCSSSSVIPVETQSSSSDEILCKQDLTLDKEEIARDLLIDEENKSSNSSPMDTECVVPDYITTSSTALLLEDVNESTQDGQSSRLLRSVSHQSGGYSGSETDEDEDYMPTEDEDSRKVIQVGSDYQAVVPEGLCKYDDAPAYENDDKLLWDPRVLPQEEVNKYFLEVQRLSNANHRGDAISTGNHCSEEEQCLYLLLQCGYNVEEALRRKRIQGAATVADSMSLWSEEECRSFEIGLKTYGKDFNMIQQHKVKTRSVAELVNFYYLWKKTERHDMFANKSRLEKKKYSLHPGTT